MRILNELLSSYYGYFTNCSQQTGAKKKNRKKKRGKEMAGVARSSGDSDGPVAQEENGPVGSPPPAEGATVRIFN